MAITAANFTLNQEQGFDATSPTAVQRFDFAGDAAYATGGSAGFGAFAAEALSRHSVDITQASGWGKTAGAITHMADYDRANDKLLVYVLATGAQVAPGSLAAVTFDITLIAR